jgi:hypothetical protein
MRGYSEFMGYWRRIVYDAGSRSFEARPVDGPFADGKAPDAETETPDLGRPAFNAAEPPKLPPAEITPDSPPDTPISPSIPQYARPLPARF